MTLRKIIPALCVISLLSGCAGMGIDKNAVIEEMIRIALEKQRAEMKKKSISLSLKADPDVNRRANAIRGKRGAAPDGAPISFKVLQLKDDSMLLSADLESLTQNLQGTLGKTYLDHDDYVLTPGQFKFIDFSPVDEDCRHIGVIAAYRDAGRATWKKVIKLETYGNKQPIHIQLKQLEVIIKSEE